jgi:hypothetical protein
MENESILRERIALLIRNGKLPLLPPARCWGGKGVGAPCVVCDRTIPDTEVDLEIEFMRGEGAPVPGLDVFHVHTRCYAVWAFVGRSESQCEQRGETP